MATVSIVITTYNRPDYLKRAIESAKLQTHPCEVIVADDSAEFLPVTEDGVTYYHLGRHDHCYLSWYDAVYRANGEYVAILHDDDYYEVNFIEECLKHIRDDVAFAFTNANILFPDGSKRDNLPIKMSSQIVEKTLAERFLLSLPMTLTPVCCLFRREDLLKSLVVGGIPGSDYNSVVCGPDKLLSLLPLLNDKYGYVGMIKEPLVNLDAGEQSTTIDAIGKAHKNKDLLTNYDKAKRFYLAVKQLKYDNYR